MRAGTIPHVRFKLYVPQELENDHLWLNKLPDAQPVHFQPQAHIPESRQAEDAEMFMQLER